MNVSRFNQSLQNSKKILSSWKILSNSDYIKKPIKSTMYNVECNEELAEYYINQVQSSNYNISLSDNSIFQFQFNNEDTLKLKYCYIQSPYDFPGYKEYIIKEYDCEFKDVGYEYRSDYEQALTEAPLKKQIMLLRYDYSEQGYKEGIHSVSHLHIGYSNSMRMTFDKILTPEAFTIFLLKQIYYDYWTEYFNDDRFKITYTNFKNRCNIVNKSNFFNELDNCDFYIT